MIKVGTPKNGCSSQFTGLAARLPALILSSISLALLYASSIIALGIFPFSVVRTAFNLGFSSAITLYAKSTSSVLVTFFSRINLASSRALFCLYSAAVNGIVGLEDVFSSVLVVETLLLLATLGVTSVVEDEFVAVLEVGVSVVEVSLLPAVLLTGADTVSLFSLA